MNSTFVPTFMWLHVTEYLKAHRACQLSDDLNFSPESNRNL